MAVNSLWRFGFWKLIKKVTLDQVPIRVGMESLMIVEIKLPKKSEDAENTETNEVQYRIKDQKEFDRVLKDAMADILQNLYGLSRRGRYDDKSCEEMEELLAMIVDNNIRSVHSLAKSGPQTIEQFYDKLKKVRTLKKLTKQPNLQERLDQYNKV